MYNDCIETTRISNRQSEFSFKPYRPFFVEIVVVLIWLTNGRGCGSYFGLVIKNQESLIRTNTYFQKIVVPNCYWHMYNFYLQSFSSIVYGFSKTHRFFYDTAVCNYDFGEIIFQYGFTLWWNLLDRNKSMACLDELNEISMKINIIYVRINQFRPLH